MLRSAARPAQATEEEWDRIAELCDDLPLALRVAGSFLAHAEDCSAADYIADLTDAQNRLDHLKVNGKTRGDVGAVLAHSARRLAEKDPALAALWQCLSVFPADFDRPAAAAVWGIKEEKDAATPLRALLERGLLLYEDDSKRYRLHDLMRPLARDVFAAVPDKDPPPGSVQRIDQAQEGFALHYMSVLSGADDLFLKGNDGVLAGLALYDQESANILAAAEWAVEKKDSHKTALTVAAYLPDAGVYVFSLRLSSRQRIGLLEAAVQAAQSLGNKNAEGSHLGNLGLAYAALGKMQRAIDHHEQALVLAREIGDRRAEGSDLGNLGNAYASLGKTRHAIDYYEQALILAREFGDWRAEGNSLGNLGNAYAAMGKTRRAIKHHEQALVISRRIGDRRGEACDLGNLGNAYYDLGKKRRAIDHHEQALDIAREIGDQRVEGNSLSNLGNAYAAMGETRRAVLCLEQALAIFEAIESPYADRVRRRLNTLRGQTDAGWVRRLLGRFRSKVWGA